MNRTISPNTATAIVIGGVIGSGIFMKPADMAAQLGSPWLLIFVWVLAGTITLFGALSNAEVAAMYPETGGQHIFFKKMYGEFFAFLYAWAAFSVFNTAGIASIAFVFSQYADSLLHLPRLDAATEHSWALHIPGVGNLFVLENLGVKALTILLVLLLSWLNIRSMKESGMLQRLLTLLKVAGMGVLILGLLASSQGHWGHFSETTGVSRTGMAFVGAFCAALSGAFWAYDGWNNITFIAGEIVRPQKNIPKSLFIGLTTCMLVYILTNIAFLYVMPIGKMAASTSVASDAAMVAWGLSGGVLITLMVMLSTLGATNANVMATSRVTYSMGEGNGLSRLTGSVHPRFGTPARAITINAFWTCLLIISGSFDILTDMLVFVSWLFYGMSALGLFILRFKYPEAERPYRVWGYPVVPAIFVVFTLFFLVSTLYTDVAAYWSGEAPVVKSVLGLLIVLVGVPVYWRWGRLVPHRSKP